MTLNFEWKNWFACLRMELADVLDEYFKIINCEMLLHRKGLADVWNEDQCKLDPKPVC